MNRPSGLTLLQPLKGGASCFGLTETQTCSPILIIMVMLLLLILFRRVIGFRPSQKFSNLFLIQFLENLSVGFKVVA